MKNKDVLVGREPTNEEIDLVSGGQSYRENPEGNGGSLAFGIASSWTSTVAGGAVGLTIGGPIGAVVGGGIGFILGVGSNLAYHSATSSSGLGGSGAASGGGGGSLIIDRTGGTRIGER